MQCTYTYAVGVQYIDRELFRVPRANDAKLNGSGAGGDVVCQVLSGCQVLQQVVTKIDKLKGFFSYIT